jgi:hypothetical protein
MCVLTSEYLELITALRQLPVLSRRDLEAVWSEDVLAFSLEDIARPTPHGSRECRARWIFAARHPVRRRRELRSEVLFKIRHVHSSI